MMKRRFNAGEANKFLRTVKKKAAAATSAKEAFLQMRGDLLAYVEKVEITRSLACLTFLRDFMTMLYGKKCKVSGDAMFLDGAADAKNFWYRYINGELPRIGRGPAARRY